MKHLASLAFALAMSGTLAHAQLPTGDLRLWLKADSLNLAEDGKVTQWVDSSPYGTVFAPRTTAEPNGPYAGGPIEEYPHLQTVTVNGKSFPTVKFERSGTAVGNPAVDRSGSADRLFQVTNRTPGSDPLAIGDGTSVTSFTVMKPNVTTAGTLGVQAVWAKRGNDASLLELGISTNGRYNYVTYDSVTEYRATNAATANKWQIVGQNIVEAGANDPVKFFVNDTENPTSPFALNPVSSNGGVISDRNDGINNDPVGVVEPFGIGGHGQDCCGEGETFSGNIAEIIIYGRTLSVAETTQVYSYLTAKYLGGVTPLAGDYNGDGIVDAGDYVVWRDNLGQFMGLTNENPLAATEGFVDEEDYDYWVANYGMTAAGLANSLSVPEPATSGLAALMGVAAVAGRRARVRRHRESTNHRAKSV
ncbi:hypothetical protein PLANPX_3343 [Lacipirellula parvula]|uniref:PEP-CTERM protein-sorting domain-containing protein n=2 Tax=Lacipirellula parvula TaxID=2650471 RepID=A0A5K7XFS8_9BACT|nr:hypothetical protein PLANPX_3343 [Lacipirellula parvula]